MTGQPAYHAFSFFNLSVNSLSEVPSVLYASGMLEQSLDCLVDVQKEPPVSPYHTAHKMNQQASSQRADFIASSTPTSLSKAHKVSDALATMPVPGVLLPCIRPTTEIFKMPQLV